MGPLAPQIADRPRVPKLGIPDAWDRRSIRASRQLPAEIWFNLKPHSGRAYLILHDLSASSPPESLRRPRLLLRVPVLWLVCCGFVTLDVCQPRCRAVFVRLRRERPPAKLKIGRENLFVYPVGALTNESHR